MNTKNRTQLEYAVLEAIDLNDREDHQSLEIPTRRAVLEMEQELMNRRIMVGWSRETETAIKRLMIHSIQSLIEASKG